MSVQHVAATYQIDDEDADVLFRWAQAACKMRDKLGDQSLGSVAVLAFRFKPKSNMPKFESGWMDELHAELQKVWPYLVGFFAAYLLVMFAAAWADRCALTPLVHIDCQCDAAAGCIPRLCISSKGIRGHSHGTCVHS